MTDGSSSTVGGPKDLADSASTKESLDMTSKVINFGEGKEIIGIYGRVDGD